MREETEENLSMMFFGIFLFVGGIAVGAKPSEMFSMANSSPFLASVLKVGSYFITAGGIGLVIMSGYGLLSNLHKKGDEDSTP